MDRRAIFFICAAVVLGLLTFVAPSEFRALTLGLGVVYALLSVASFADWRSIGRRSDQGRS